MATVDHSTSILQIIRFRFLGEQISWTPDAALVCSPWLCCVHCAFQSRSLHSIFLLPRSPPPEKQFLKVPAAHATSPSLREISCHFPSAIILLISSLQVARSSMFLW